MKTLFAIVTVGLTAFAGTAQADTQNELSAQQKFNRFNVRALATTLSNAQLTKIRFIDNNGQTAGSTRMLLTKAAGQ